MIGPGIVILIFFFLCVGVVANSPEFQQHNGPAIVKPFWVSAFKHYNQVFSSLFHVPEVCLPGRAVNDFQVHQCNQFWDQLAKSGGLAVTPFFILAIVVFLGMDQLKGIYKKVQNKANKGKAALSGTVTHPAEAPGDLFSWFFCLRPVMVQLPNKSQIKVYVPLESILPTPGQTMAIFEPIMVLGEKRHFAIIYAPHVAVVRGT